MSGKLFEQLTDHTPKLLQNGFVRQTSTYWVQYSPGQTITFVSQHAFKSFMKQHYGIQVFRLPDEAYIIERGDTRILKILEKRAQHVEGSTELKLLTGPSIKREYQLMVGKQFQVEYAFCLNSFLYDKLISNTKKYRILKRILREAGIPFFHGDASDYFELLGHWVSPLFQKRYELRRSVKL